MTPLVSILIPAFNAEAWIAETLKSAIQQTWRRTEIIVVNDGSTDRTAEIAGQFASANIAVLNQENQGAATARNLAFAASQGDFIQWLDADDVLSPTKVAEQMSVLDSSATATVASCPWGRFISRPHRAKFVPSPLWCDLSPLEWMLRKMEHNAYMQTATWLVSRELTHAAGLWDTKLLGDDDGEFFARILLRAKAIRFVPSANVYYRMPSPGNLSYIGRSKAKMDAQFRSMQMAISYIRSLDDGHRTRMACVTYLRNWLDNFYPDSPDIVYQAVDMATELGGHLESPKLSWKYAVIQRLFGWNVVQHARVALPKIRWSVARTWDRALFIAESALPRTLITRGPGSSDIYRD